MRSVSETPCMSIDYLKNHVSSISRCEEFRTSFIKRHRSLINAQCLLSSVFTLDVACNYVFILGRKNPRRFAYSRVGCACSINNTAIHASTYRLFRGRARVEPAGRYRRTRGCFNASSDARGARVSPAFPFRRETARGRLLQFADRRIKIPLSDRKVRTPSTML